MTATNLQRTAEVRQNGRQQENAKTTQPKIINMSSRGLSNEEIKLLERGLKFTPTLKQNRSKLKTDSQEFSRKIRLLEYFNDQQPNGDDKSLVKNPSNFVPPMSEDKYLNIFIEATKNYHKQHATAKKSNLTRGEQNALNELKNDDTIIIKEADKGGATVIMDKTFYRAKVHEMLADNERYTELTDLNYDDKIIKKIGKHLKKFDQETTKKEKNIYRISRGKHLTSMDFQTYISCKL